MSEFSTLELEILGTIIWMLIVLTGVVIIHDVRIHFLDIRTWRLRNAERKERECRQ